MSTTAPFLIVGASLGGAKAAEALRQTGYDGPVVLLGAESELPYERPPLSKGYLQGKADRDTIYVHSRDWYAEADIDLRLGVRVASVQPAAYEVVLADGSALGHAKLPLATGSRPRRLEVPGGDLDGVLYLRSVGDSERIKAAIAGAGSVAVIGAGWIGLEVSAAAREVGVEVTVLEPAELPLLRVLGPEVARVFATLHADHGVDLRFGIQVTEITGSDGHADGVLLSDGSRVPADAVIVGIGVAPATELAAGAGLDVGNGIVVDASLRTSHPDIYAAGDVASAFHPLVGTHIRVEHWANALNQPQAAARAMAGEQVSYDRVPYFFSDQYDLGMEYSGWVEPGRYDEVVFRGDVGRREFIAFWLGAGNRVLAGMNVNVWDVTESIQALVRGRQPVDKAALADPGTSLDAVATRD